MVFKIKQSSVAKLPGILFIIWKKELIFIAKMSIHLQDY